MCAPTDHDLAGFSFATGVHCGLKVERGAERRCRKEEQREILSLGSAQREEKRKKGQSFDVV